ncbi:MAG: DUF1127 domain-containing protein [Acidisphaera sp.]|nr:DUF1127 domain-containing protein [Acidisphaera sp.]
MDAPYDITTELEHRIAQGGPGIGRIAAWFAERRRIGRTVAELRHYTDRELADMGLTRADIPAVARGQLRR